MAGVLHGLIFNDLVNGTYTSVLNNVLVPSGRRRREDGMICEPMPSTTDTLQIFRPGRSPGRTVSVVQKDQPPPSLPETELNPLQLSVVSITCYSAK